MGSYKPFH
uniref:Transmembrane protein 234-like protein n=1 Tax=Triatoma infestans TaxID=30076 RepID=A0A161MFE2_TRIIF